MIQVTGAKVNLTEQTVRELLSAIEEAKKITTFTDEPMPDGDMDSQLERDQNHRNHWDID